MKNATSIVLFSFSYLVLFGFLLGIAGLGSFTFSFAEFLMVVVVSVTAAVAAAVALATLANTEVSFLGFSISAHSGEYVWRGAMYTVVGIWSAYFVLKLTNLMPSGTPAFVSILFLGPPLVALLWAMFATFLKSGVEG